MYVLKLKESSSIIIVAFPIIHAYSAYSSKYEAYELYKHSHTDNSKGNYEISWCFIIVQITSWMPKFRVFRVCQSPRETSLTFSKNTLFVFEG